VERLAALPAHSLLTSIANEGLRAKFVPVAGIDWSF
jgi:hypothetical protein